MGARTDRKRPPAGSSRSHGYDNGFPTGRSRGVKADRRGSRAIHGFNALDPSSPSAEAPTTYRVDGQPCTGPGVFTCAHLTSVNPPHKTDEMTCSFRVLRDRRGSSSFNHALSFRVSLFPLRRVAVKFRSSMEFRIDRPVLRLIFPLFFFFFYLASIKISAKFHFSNSKIILNE